jgi:hypothetical protein
VQEGEIDAVPQGPGYAVAGPGFYTGQQEWSEALSWAKELRPAACRFAVARRRCSISPRPSSSGPAAEETESECMPESDCNRWFEPPVE